MLFLIMWLFVGDYKNDENENKIGYSDGSVY